MRLSEASDWPPWEASYWMKQEARYLDGQSLSLIQPNSPYVPIDQ